MADPKPTVKSFRRGLQLALLLIGWQFVQSFAAVWFPAQVDPINPGSSSLAAIEQTAELLSLVPLFLLATLILGLTHRTNIPPTDPSSASNSTFSRLTIAGLCIAASLIAGVGFAANPWGMYASTILPPRIENSREFKTTLYENLNYAPQIIVLGSSRFISIPPDYLEEKTGAAAFNASFFGGRPIDHLTFAKLVFTHQPDAPPAVLFVEINGLLSAESTADLISTPSRWLPYLSSEDELRWWGTRAQSLLDINYFADSIYTWRYQKTHAGDTLRWQNWEFDSLGGGHRPPDPNFREVLIDRVENTQRIECHLQDQIPDLTSLVALADSYGTAVVLSTVPYHPAFYQAVLEESESYHACLLELEGFVTRLMTLYDDVYYQNFDELHSIGGLDTTNGFYDHQHISPANARILVDAILPTLIIALEP